MRTIVASRPTRPSVQYPCPHCAAFPFDTEAELAEHVAEAHPGTRFVQAPNGWGGTTTVRVQAAAPAQGPKPPTERQLAYLRSLLAERQGVPAAEAVRDTLNTHRTAGTLGSAVVSRAITTLLATPRAPKPAAEPQPTDLPDVPQGHYAITSTGDNDLAFYRVDRPEDGAYAGRVFVKLVVGGHPDRNVPRSHVAGVLARIAEAGPAKAAQLYGQEIGRCSRCNRHLTDDESRAAGMGPDCRSRGV